MRSDFSMGELDLGHVYIQVARRIKTDFKKKILNASRPSEHPPVRGENVKTFRWDHRLQIHCMPGTSTNTRCSSRAFFIRSILIRYCTKVHLPGVYVSISKDCMYSPNIEEYGSTG